MAEAETPTILMDANLLEPWERDYELAVRNIREFPYIYTKAGFLNSKFNEEQGQNIDPVLAYPMIGDVEQEKRAAIANIPATANWIFNNLTAYWWNNATIRDVQEMHTRMVHWHMRLQRLNRHISMRAVDLEAQCQRAIFLAASILARHTAPEVSVELGPTDNRRIGVAEETLYQTRQFDRVPRPPSVLSGYSTATETGIGAEDVESIHHSTQYGEGARRAEPPMQSPIMNEDNPIGLFRPINPGREQRNENGQQNNQHNRYQPVNNTNLPRPQPQPVSQRPIERSHRQGFVDYDNQRANDARPNERPNPHNHNNVRPYDGYGRYNGDNGRQSDRPPRHDRHPEDSARDRFSYDNGNGYDEYDRRSERDGRPRAGTSRAGTPMPETNLPNDRPSRNHVHFDEIDEQRRRRANETRTTRQSHSRFEREEYVRESNQANSYEQQSLRRWLNNRDYDGTTLVDEQKLLSTETFLRRVRDYQRAQRVSDTVVLRNIAQSMCGAAAIWWAGNVDDTFTMDDFEQRLRMRFAPETRDTKRAVSAFYSRTQQPDEFLLDYFDNMRFLLSRIPNERVSEDDAIDTIVHGVNDKYTPCFVGQRPSSLRELQDICSQLVAKQQRTASVPVAKSNNPAPRQNRRVNMMAMDTADEMESVPSWEDADDKAIEMRDAYVMAARQANQQKHNENGHQKAGVSEQLRTDHPVNDEIFCRKIGEKYLCCFNCRLRGHNHFACPYVMRQFCYGCGEPNSHIDTCEFCKKGLRVGSSQHSRLSLRSSKKTHTRV